MTLALLSFTPTTLILGASDYAAPDVRIVLVILAAREFSMLGTTSGNESSLTDLSVKWLVDRSFSDSAPNSLDDTPTRVLLAAGLKEAALRLYSDPIETLEAGASMPSLCTC
ncbi:hypothetical protein DFH09DRAFT_1339185 [Mycena vulgaris]|nr:hypothetical protein DFH09DRAFT_1339185 [Mycena vulgaris]